MRKSVFVRCVRLLENKLTPGMEALSNLPLFVAVRSGLVVALPLVLVGSLAVLLNSFPLPAYKEFMEAAFGRDWRFFGDVLWSCTFAAMALTMQFSVGTHLAEQHNARNPRDMVNPLVVGLVSFSALLCLIAAEEGELATRWMGVSGLFVAFLTALTSVKTFLFLYSFKRLRFYLPGGAPDFVLPDTFNALGAGFLTIVFFACFGAGVRVVFGASVHECAHMLLRLPFDLVGDSMQRGIFYIFSLQSLWFIGVHGANALDPITHDIYGAAMAANELAASLGQPLPYVMTKPFMDVFVFMGGAGTSISLALALLLFGDGKSQKRLAGISFLPGVFNLNEILLFGLPVILNPVMLIPFIATPLVLAAISYAAVASGLVPGTSAHVEWTTPVFLNAYLSTGSFKGVLLQAVNLGVGTCIYAPFVLIGNTINSRRRGKAFRKLFKQVTEPASAVPKTIEGADEAGLVARGLLVDLEHAFRSKTGLFLEYQPQIDAISGRADGVEAFIRWNHPHHGAVPAPVTVALAEASGLIKPLGLWIFDQACAVRKQWFDAGVENLVMAVNISALQLDAALVDELVNSMKKHNVMPDFFELELTESAVLDGAPQSAHLARLHMLGLRIAIDDFGMGHSSLKYLKQFPVSTVKIDGAISREVVTNPICADIVASITRLCRARRMTCIAEFVEADAQAGVLRTLGVDVFQGYKYSRPLSADECLAFIRETNMRAGAASGHPRGG